MAEMGSGQRERYWKYTVRVTAILLGVWAFVTFVLGGVLASQLDSVTVLGFPGGYYVAAQGALLVYVIEIAVHARLMNAKDRAYLSGRDGA